MRWTSLARVMQLATRTALKMYTNNLYFIPCDVQWHDSSSYAVVTVVMASAVVTVVMSSAVVTVVMASAVVTDKKQLNHNLHVYTSISGGKKSLKSHNFA